MDSFLPAEYGYVILVAVASIFLLQWLGFKVGFARKKYEIKYPAMYDNHDPHGMFNCIQRAHQNTLEAYPVFLILLFFGGLQAPLVSALCGIVWIASRVVYAMGYYTGNPANRQKGAFGYIGVLVLLINTIWFALRLLQIL